MVERFEFTCPDCDPDTVAVNHGRYVRHSDYEALERDNADLQQRLVAVRDDATRADNDLCAMEARAEAAERRNAELEADKARLNEALRNIIGADTKVTNLGTEDQLYTDGPCATIARAALAGSGGGWHLCGCPEMGTYEGQVTLVAPDWLKDKWPNGIGIDVCLALEIQHLWRAGIRTSGHCCGHGRAPAFISVLPKSIDAMKALGYSVSPHPDGAGREDHFVPKTPPRRARGHPLSEGA